MDELLKYYQELDALVRKLRTAQIEADKYKARSFYESARRYAKQVDELIRKENQRRKSLQTEIKFYEQ